MSCDQVTELAPELALDVADGHERDTALRHLEACVACRRLVSELSEVADGLLLLAPAIEPPPNLEARVFEVMQGRPVRRSREATMTHRSRTTRSRWTSGLAAVAGFVLAVAIGAASVLVATAGDRRVAGDYRAVLGAGGGSFFAVSPLRSGANQVGTAWGYQGDPSWVFISVWTPESPSSYRVWLLTDDGRREPLGTVELGAARAGWGRDLPVDLTSVRELHLMPVQGGPALVATFHPEDPWSSG